MFCVAFVAFDANAFWMVDSNTPTAAQVSADFKGKNGSLVGVLLINFISERNCNAEVAFVNFEGEKLGIPVAQELADWKMTIWVDGKVVWHEKTGINDYVNGFETGGFATNEFIDKLVKGNEVVIQPLSEPPLKFVFTLEKSGLAIDKARKNCR